MNENWIEQKSVVTTRWGYWPEAGPEAEDKLVPLVVHELGGVLMAAPPPCYTTF
jgi:hypothetical protein